MAEFSYEYTSREDLGPYFDFSITDVFEDLFDGQEVDVICEGFGSTKIKRIGNKCLLWFPRIQKYVELDDVMGAKDIH